MAGRGARRRPRTCWSPAASAPPWPPGPCRRDRGWDPPGTPGPPSSSRAALIEVSTLHAAFGSSQRPIGELLAQRPDRRDLLLRREDPPLSFSAEKPIDHAPGLGDDPLGVHRLARGVRLPARVRPPLVEEVGAVWDGLAYRATEQVRHGLPGCLALHVQAGHLEGGEDPVHRTAGGDRPGEPVPVGTGCSGGRPQPAGFEKGDLICIRWPEVVYPADRRKPVELDTGMEATTGVTRRVHWGRRPVPTPWSRPACSGSPVSSRRCRPPLLPE